MDELIFVFETIHLLWTLLKLRIVYQISLNFKQTLLWEY